MSSRSQRNGHITAPTAHRVANGHRWKSGTSAEAIALLLHSEMEAQAPQPLTLGIPLPRGRCTDPAKLWLRDAAGHSVPLQTVPLAHWSDGSAKWILADFLAAGLPRGQSVWALDSAADEVERCQAGLVIRDADT